VSARLGLPRGDRLLREPHCQAAAGVQARIIGLPVCHPGLLLEDVVALNGKRMPLVGWRTPARASPYPKPPNRVIDATRRAGTEPSGMKGRYRSMCELTSVRSAARFCRRYDEPAIFSVPASSPSARLRQSPPTACPRRRHNGAQYPVGRVAGRSLLRRPTPFMRGGSNDDGTVQGQICGSPS
jgi:hypothetical protein